MIITLKRILKKLNLWAPTKFLFDLRFRLLSLVGILLINNYFSRAKKRKLHLGCGSNFLPGWLNSDLKPVSIKTLSLDSSKRLPFLSGTFDYVLSEHHFEHLSYHDGQGMLRECFRILKPGGTLRIATPDLATLLGLYVSNKSSIQEQYIHWITDNFLPEGSEPSACLVINNAFRNWGHQFLYDQKTLVHSLEKAGFTQITKNRPGQSADPNLTNLKAHGKIIGDEKINNFETLVLEAKKPILNETFNRKGCEQN